MVSYICVRRGVQYAATVSPPAITSPCQGQASGGLPSGSFRSAMIASTGALRGGWWQAMPKVQ